MLTIFDPKKPIDFVRMMPVATKISFALPLLALVLLLVRGVNWGIDFAGGTEMQVKFEKAVATDDIRKVLDKIGFDKKQVQQYGPPEGNELLIRVERITSMKAEDAQRIQQLVASNAEALKLAGVAPEDIKVDFKADEGDRITVSLPTPKVTAPAAKNADPAAVDAALNARLSQGDVKAPLDDAALDALSTAGFSRAAVVTRAKELGYEVTASADKQVEPGFNQALELERTLDAQQAALSKLLDEQSDFKLRRTKRAGESEATTADAIQRDEPHQGRVKYLVQFQGVSADIAKALSDSFGNVEVRRVDFVDAKVAEQLRTDGLLAVLLALLAILVYVTVRFNVYFAPGAIVALAHDSLLALAVFPLFWLEFDLPSIAAILTVVGYSINDTIVIYDRIRERMPAEDKRPATDEEVKAVVNQAINETFSRSINTVLTTLFASIALIIFTRGAIENFAIVLTVGFVVGAYSSIFVASSMFLWLRKNFHDPDAAQKRQRSTMSREEKARGVV